MMLRDDPGLGKNSMNITYNFQNIHIFRYTTHDLELQIIVNLAIWYTIGYLYKRICLPLPESKLQHRQN